MKIKPSQNSKGVVMELRATESQIPMAMAEPTLKSLPEFRLRRILVPVDFSECSRKALLYALPFARQFGASIELLHVLEPFVPVPEMTAVNFDLSRDEMLTAAHKQLKELQQSIPAEVTLETVLREGKPHIEIVSAAKASGADLIIVSTHGHTGLAHVFLGSTAERVVQHAPCPVLVVREQEQEFVTNTSSEREISVLNLNRCVV